MIDITTIHNRSKLMLICLLLLLGFNLAIMFAFSPKRDSFEFFSEHLMLCKEYTDCSTFLVFSLVFYAIIIFCVQQISSLKFQAMQENLDHNNTLLEIPLNLALVGNFLAFILIFLFDHSHFEHSWIYRDAEDFDNRVHYFGVVLYAVTFTVINVLIFFQHLHRTESNNPSNTRGVLWTTEICLDCCYIILTISFFVVWLVSSATSSVDTSEAAKVLEYIWICLAYIIFIMFTLIHITMRES